MNRNSSTGRFPCLFKFVPRHGNIDYGLGLMKFALSLAEKAIHQIMFDKIHTEILMAGPRKVNQEARA